MAACWSPRMPAIGTPASGPSRHRPVLLGGRADLRQHRAAGRPSRPRSPAPTPACRGPSAGCATRSSRRSRAPRPPVRFHSSQESIVPNASVARRSALDVRPGSSAPSARRSTSPAAARCARGTCRPGRARRRWPASGCPARRSPGPPARRSLRSHTTVVSRWLVIPTAATSAASTQPAPARRRRPLGCSPRSRSRRAPPSRAAAGAGRARPGRSRRSARRGRTGCSGSTWCPGRWQRRRSAASGIAC